jgi:hypothetical protein
MDKIVKVLLLGALFFIVFSFFAPLIFTYDSLFNIDFSQDGPVGDTIGGLMNPFVAIAGVILTFVAFYIQYLANKEQRAQFFIALDETSLQDELKCRDALQLFQFDIANTIEGIEKQCKQIQTFSDTLDKDPCSEIECYRIPTLAMERYQSIDRSVLLHSFDLYEIDSKNLHDAYDSLDYCYVGVKELFEVEYNRRTSDIQKKKEELLQSYEEFYSVIINCWRTHPFRNPEVGKVISAFEKENKELTKGGVLNVSRLSQDLESNGFLRVNMPGFEALFSFPFGVASNKMRDSLNELESCFNEYKTQVAMFSRAMRNRSKEFDDKRMELEKIRDGLKESLEKNTPESIRKRHDEKLHSMQ